MGWVSAKPKVVAEKFTRPPAGAVLEMTDQAVGAVMLSLKRALRSGWSKQGKAMLASIGTKRV
jgi:hypothetical protein